MFDLYFTEILPFNCLICLLALVIDRLWGEPDIIYKRISHPVVIFGKILNYLNSKLYNNAAPKIALLYGGLTMKIFTASITGFSILLSYLLFDLGVIGILILGLLSSTLLAHKSLVDHVSAVIIPLEQNDLSDAKIEISKIVGRDTQNLNEYDIARAAVETTAENYSDGIIAPWLFSLLFGLPGIVFYKLINTADSMIGYRNEKYLYYGRIAARLDDAVNFIPARLTAIIFIILNLNSNIWLSLKQIKQEAKKHSSINAGWPEAAMAILLNLALAGPRLYQGQLTDDLWINEKGNQAATPQHIKNALKIISRSWWCLFVITGLLTGLFQAT